MKAPRPANPSIRGACPDRLDRRFRQECPDNWTNPRFSLKFLPIPARPIVLLSDILGAVWPAAEAGSGLHEAQLVNNIVPGVSSVREEQEVALAQPHAATMCEKIADRHFARDVGIIHLEGGQTLVNAIIPGDVARVDQRRERRRRKGFGVGSDAKEMLRLIGVL